VAEKDVDAIVAYLTAMPSQKVAPATGKAQDLTPKWLLMSQVEPDNRSTSIIPKYHPNWDAKRRADVALDPMTAGASEARI
jgi:hypothetical protein